MVAAWAAGSAEAVGRRGGGGVRAGGLPVPAECGEASGRLRTRGLAARGLAARGLSRTDGWWCCSLVMARRGLEVRAVEPLPAAFRSATAT